MVPFFCFSQYNQGGYIVPSKALLDSLPKERAIYLPQDGLNFYNAPNGEFRGRIRLGSPVNNSMPIQEHEKNLFATIAPYNNTPTMLDLSFFFHRYDDCYYLKFDQQKDGFVRMEEEGLEMWIALEDIQKGNFELSYWMDFYGSIGQTITPPPTKKLALKTSPYTDAKTLVKVDEDHFEIQVIAFEEAKSCEGSFCYVSVIHFKKHPCYGGSYESDNVIKRYKGWLQLIDEHGKRLVLHHPKGC